MRMSEEEHFGNVSALRAQIQGKLAIVASEPPPHREIQQHLPSRPATPTKPAHLQSPSDSPPIPAHRPFLNELDNVLKSGLGLPPRVPQKDRKFSHPTEVSLSRNSSNGTLRPAIAPKPKFNDARKGSAPALSMSGTKAPEILVSAIDDVANNNDDSTTGHTHNGSSNGNGDVVKRIHSPALSNGDLNVEHSSVIARARQFEQSGGIPIQFGFPETSSANTTMTNNRPESTISTLSLTSYDQELSESDSDDDRPAELLRRNLGLELLSPGKMGGRRPSASCFNGDITMHDKIMDELKRQGVVRSSSHQHLFKKKVESHPPRIRRNVSDAATKQAASVIPDDVVPEPENGIPDDVGKMREDKKAFQPRVPDVTLSTASSHSDESQDRGNSFISDRSSILTASSEQDGVLDYHTGDPDEDKRLKKLHYAANEFYTVQKNFLKYLIDMGEVYPQYVVEFGKRLGKDLLSPVPGQPFHPVIQLKDLFVQLIAVHKILLEQFATQNANWTSLSPCMADVILKYSDFLKMCKPFLLEKSRFVHELTKLREENKDFDNATLAFEQRVFNRGVGAVVQQLDQVHQNFMRYKILMMSYRNYLKEGCEEYEKTNDAISKLEKITQSVNEAMGLPSNEELFKLYDRFQCQFDVFYPGRRLIHQGEVTKQTRKEPQPRFLVLFSDVLWICRVASGLGVSGLFDLNRSYRIPVESVRTEVSEHEDYERQLWIKSKERSVTLILNSVRERQQWEKDIKMACEEKRKYKRRMSEVQERQRRASNTPLNIPTTLLETSLNVTDQPEAEVPSSPCDEHTMSRSQSVDSPGQSQPCTPTEDMPAGPSISSRPMSKKKVKRAEKDKPLWIPDDSSTKCLMEGCGSVFSLLNRRHHCRDCGWLICSTCSGRAPLSKFDFKKELVCPECYATIMEKYNGGTLFPSHLLVKTSDNQWRVRIRKDKNKSPTLVEPQTLFCAPIHSGLKRMKIEDRMQQDDSKVFGKVFVKQRKGAEMLRFAQLTDGMILKFFKAPFDDEPCEQHVIYGFLLKETVLDEGGTQFELVHRNQIRTDRKEHVIVFRVAHQKSIQKWSNALQQGLGGNSDHPTVPSP